MFLTNILQVEEFAAVQERKRNHIAHNIHDSLGHALAVLNIQLQSALKFWQVDLHQAHQYVLQSKQLGSFAMQEVRRSVNTLRVDIPKERSLQMAIAFLAREFHHTTGILPTTQLNLTSALPPQQSKTIYRIVQEALTNIYKHAEATAVHIPKCNSRVSVSDYRRQWQRLSIRRAVNGVWTPTDATKSYPLKGSIPNRK
ncbi:MULTISPECIES: sensor histidine kinase [Fischerella]|uniref:sensor histidine kinase n=1 Tax=Fischerella TaxID=1190 RepID=UPI000722A6AC|nr:MULTISPECIES: histidine kinase [Fischerella]BAU04123.1 response regulator receiver sensor signal transduction histidine kinase [Fischerella sp. NIES-3754]BCX06546.1 MAG: hypothetical protein KatS3mg066_0405 [Fischerella sp.]